MGEKVLLKLMNFHDFIMFFNSDLQWIDLSRNRNKNRSLLSVCLIFFCEEKCRSILAASVCISRF